MQTRLSLLLPRPQTPKLTSTRCTLPDEPVIRLASPGPHVQAAADRLAAALRSCGCRPRWSATGNEQDSEAAITLRIRPVARSQPQGYRLTIDHAGVAVVGADEAGLFYGVCTLIQLIRLHVPPSPRQPLTLPGCRITDWPDFPHRGVLLDVSRDKVPTMATLCDLVDLLASWKVNQVQLYMEHTFAYRGHEVVWADASPFTGEEIEALDAFCRMRYVELVPNQNSLGHMHRWLIHEPYRRLAECPDGIAHPFSRDPEPYGLCPTDPGSLALLADLYAQLLPHFSSRQFNVGLDETFDLGQGRSAAHAAATGKARVYLDFLTQVHRLVTGHGRTMQCWADMLRQWPELVGDAPRDIVLLEWGYEADHPFLEHCRRFAAAGLRLYACPGTSSWNSLAGRTDNAVANIRGAAAAGRVTGAIGLLTTDWGDNGHLQPLPVSYPGFLAGAALGWCSTEESTIGPDLPARLDAHAFQDEAGVMGRLVHDLGNAYLHTGAPIPNASVLFHLLIFADRPPPTAAMAGLSVQRLEETHAYLEKVVAPLPQERMARPDAATIREEFRWVADMLRLACRLGIARLRAGPDAPLAALASRARSGFREELRELIDRHRQLWLGRNRPGGLRDSAARLERIVTLLDA